MAIDDDHLVGEEVNDGQPEQRDDGEDGAEDAANEDELGVARGGTQVASVEVSAEERGGGGEDCRVGRGEPKKCERSGFRAAYKREGGEEARQWVDDSLWRATPESSEDMHAAMVAARLSPSSPGGSRWVMSSGSASLEPREAISSGKSRRATRPGRTIRKTGVT